MTVSFLRDVEAALPANLQATSGTSCNREQQADIAVGDVRRDESDDGLTFAGAWTDEVLARAGAYFDVPAAAVRRRMGGMKTEGRVA